MNAEAETLLRQAANLLLLAGVHEPKLRRAVWPAGVARHLISAELQLKKSPKSNEHADASHEACLDLICARLRSGPTPPPDHEVMKADMACLAICCRAADNGDEKAVKFVVDRLGTLGDLLDKAVEAL